MRRGLLPAVGRGHAGRGIEPVLRSDGWRHGCGAVGHREVRRAAHVPELREHVVTPFSCIALVILFQPATCSSEYIPGAPHHPRPAIEIDVASERMRLPSEARCVSYSSIRSPGRSPGCSDRERVRSAITTRCVRVQGPTCTGHGHAMALPCGPQMVIKDWTKAETQLIANPSYPRSALSLHFSMYAGRPPAKASISRGLPGMFTPKYQESARGKRVVSASASTCARHASSAGTVASIRVQLRWRR